MGSCCTRPRQPRWGRCTSQPRWPRPSPGGLAVYVNAGQWVANSPAAAAGWALQSVPGIAVGISDHDFLTAPGDTPANARYEGLLADGISIYAAFDFWAWGGSASQAAVADCLGTRLGTIEAIVPAGSGPLAREARVVAAESAAATANGAVADRLGMLEARAPAGNGQLATSASVEAVQIGVNAVDGKVTANTDSIQRLTAAVGSALTLFKPSFELDTGWNGSPSSDLDTIPTGYSYVTTAPHSGARHLRINGGGQGAIYNRSKLTVAVGDDVDVSFWCGSIGSAPDGYVRLSISWRKADGSGNGAVATSAQQSGTVARWTKVNRTGAPREQGRPTSLIGRSS